MGLLYTSKRVEIMTWIELMMGISTDRMISIFSAIDIPIYQFFQDSLYVTRAESL